METPENFKKIKKHNSNKRKTKTKNKKCIFQDTENNKCLDKQKID
jgi:hypothetical protein